ncbi:MAG TPA: hypothetical protein VJZ68_00045 [Nitrososphaera sp.]|nr:hypothetical protein [Nitrososphaera sp.]
MKRIALLAVILVVLSFSAFNFKPALGHEELCRNGICIVGGWVNEPPLVGQLNGIELEVTRESDGQPITNALALLDISVKKGALTRSLDFQPQEEPGIYAASMLPTQTGQYAVVMKGTVASQAVDGQIEIEDVEDAARFNFPPASTSNGLSDEVVEQLQTVITDLTAQVTEANIAAKEAMTAAASATESSAELKMAADRAYLFGMIGVGVGVAGIAIGVAALSRREKA